MFVPKEELRAKKYYKGIPESNTIAKCRSIFSASTTDSEETNNELEKEYNELKIKYSELDAEHKNLKENHKNLSSDSEETNNELEKEYNELKIKYSELDAEHKNLKENHKNLSSDSEETNNELEKKYNELKIKYSELDAEHKNLKENKKNNNKEFIYNKLNPQIDSIKSEYKIENGNIIHKSSTAVCYEKINEKLEEKINNNCHKIHHIHKLMDSLGMDKNKEGKVDESHKEFLDFIDNNKLSEQHKLSFNKLSEDYTYACKKGKKVPIEKATAIKYKDTNNSTNDKECFKMESGKLTTYGENSFSGECAPILSTYRMTQEDNIPHYNGYNLTNHNDKDFHEILKHTDTESYTDL